MIDIVPPDIFTFSLTFRPQSEQITPPSNALKKEMSLNSHSPYR